MPCQSLSALPEISRVPTLFYTPNRLEYAETELRIHGTREQRTEKKKPVNEGRIAEEIVYVRKMVEWEI